MTDNGSAHVSRRFRQVCKRWCGRRLRTHPSRPETNGKAERFIPTMIRGWAYRWPYQTSNQCTKALPKWLRYYNEQKQTPSGTRHDPPKTGNRCRSMSPRPHSSGVQRCHATVMFADIIGFTDILEAAGPELAYVLVTGALKLLDGIARRHGAVVDKYLGDALMAVFGWPIPSREHPRAAIEASLEMQRALTDYAREVESPAPLALQVGLNTGEILAADVRGALVREFAVMGDPVNVAARLKDLAPRGAVYVGEQTQAEAIGGFSFRPLAELALKGKQVRIRTYELLPGPSHRPTVARAADALRIAELQGRDDEMTALLDAMASLARGEGGCILLEGERGVGKSRLLTELAESKPAAGSALAVLRAPNELDLRTALEARDPCQPLAVLVDDLHAAVPEALSVLEAALLRAAAEPLLFVIAVPSDRKAALHRLLETASGVLGERLRTLVLAPLGLVAARALVDAALGDGPISDATRELVMTRAGGNPFRLLTGALLAPALETEAARAGDGVERSTETERRRATVLFADITGFTALTEKTAPEEAHAIVSDCLQILDSVARKHGASVDKYLGDCVMAVFGVPVAIEGAPRAAVNAAIEMRRRVQDWNRERGFASPLDVHIGIETGLGIAGDVSGPMLREFALMGKSVNAASRLKDLAPRGRIFVGEEARRATRTDFEYRLCELPPRGDDGRSPLVHFELLSERESLHRARVGSDSTIFLDLVGRDTELARLRARVAGVQRAEGGIAVVMGDAGLGKSRLLAELAASPETHGVRWLEGRSLSIGGTLSFHPFADLLRAWCGIEGGRDEPAPVAPLEKEMRQVLGADAEEHLPFVATLLSLPLSGARAKRVEETRGETREKLITRSVRALLFALASHQPLVLCFEDLHWADASSIELLETILRLTDEAPVLFLLAARPGFSETSGRILRAAREHYAERLETIELQPLRSGDTRRLLASLFRHGGLPVASRERIEQQAGGNPFYVEEVIRSLLEQGAIESHETGLAATEKIYSAVIPATVQEVILSRVDRLDPGLRQLLQLASVIGRSFHIPVLSSLVSDPVAIAGNLAKLANAQLLVQQTDADGPAYAFKHPMIQQITYDSILERKREEVHRAVGSALEASLTEGGAGVYATLAYHFGRGRDLEQAERYLFAAGDEAARSAASNEALHFFQEASRLYREIHGAQADPAKMALLEKNVGLAFFNRGLLPESCRHLNRALEHMGERIPQGRFEMGRRFVGTLLSVLPPLYLPLMVRGRPAATDEQLEVIRVMFSRAKAQVTGDPARFLFDGMENLRKLARVDPRTVEGVTGLYAGVIGIFSFGGISFSVSERFLRLAREALNDRDAREVLLYRMMSFVHHFLGGGWGREHEIESTLIEEGLAYGQLWEISSHLGLEAIKQLAQGRFAESRINLEKIAKIEDNYAYDLASSNRHGVTSFWLAERRELDAALEATEVYYTEHDEPMLNVLALGWKAKLQVFRGDIEPARETLGVADQIMAKEGLMPPFNRGSAERSRLLLAVARLELAKARGDRGAARALAREARRAARRALFCARRVAWQRTEVYAYVARLRWLVGDTRGARRWWRRALEEGTRLGQRPERARACLEIGAALLGAGRGEMFGRDPDSWLDEARREFEEMDLAWDLARLEAIVSGGNPRASIASAA